MSAAKPNKASQLPEPDQTLAEYSMGTLWDGIGDIHSDGFGACEDILLGQSIPNANDMRSMMLSGFAGRSTCIDIVRENSDIAALDISNTVTRPVKRFHIVFFLMRG